MSGWASIGVVVVLGFLATFFGVKAEAARRKFFIADGEPDGGEPRGFRARATYDDFMDYRLTQTLKWFFIGALASFLVTGASQGW